MKFSDRDLRRGCEALLAQQRPGTTWDDLSETERGNLEADVEAVFAVLGYEWDETNA